MIDNGLYGFTRISKSEGHGDTPDVFEDGKLVDPGKPSVLSRRSYIDDILIYANNWDQLCDRVEGLLEAWDKWNLSIKASQARIQQVLETENVDQRPQEDQVVDHRKTLDLEASDLTEVDPRWIHAHRPFSVLKAKIAATPILRHFDPDRRATVVVYASDWAISGSLMPEYDQIYYPVMFASRNLKFNKLNYGIAEKEVLALLRILDLNYNALQDWNGNADCLASAALQRQCDVEVETEEEIQDLVTLNRLDEILMVKIEDEIAQISAVTTRSKARSGVRTGSDPDSLREEVVRELRIERIRQAEDEESWISGLKKYLVGEIRDLTQEDAKVFGSIAMNYEVDQSDLLFYCPITKEAAADRDKVAIKGSVAPMTGFVITFTGKGCTRVCSDMWENVLTVKR
ncbi:reverse transcriptase, partial [Phytophthora megakarya]